MLKSELTGRHYYGHTSNLEQRLKSHQSTQNKYTRGKGPWILVGYINCDTKEEAIRLELKLKKMKNSSRAKAWLKNNGNVR